METTPFFKKVKENLTADTTRGKMVRGFITGIAVQKIQDHTRNDWNNNVDGIQDIQSNGLPPNN